MMDPSEVQHPRRLSMTCVECQTIRTFEAVDADVSGYAVLYECIECDHRTRLDLDP